MVILIVIAMWFVLKPDQYATLEGLKASRTILEFWIVEHYLLSVILLIVGYTILVAFSLPGAVFITIGAGFLFGPWWGTVYSVVGASLGAIAVFFLAKFLFVDFFRKKVGRFLAPIKSHMRENELSYLLILRLVPIFPFWLVNIVPAFLDIRPRTYIIATMIGVIPGTFVYALLGDSVGALLGAHDGINLKIIFEPRFLVPILGLSFLAAVPILYRRFRKRGCKLTHQ